MSADEIRRLVRIYSAKEKNLKDQLDKFKDAEMTPNLENISIARNDAIITIQALLSYAEMVERCEKTRIKLELNKKDYANRGVCGSLVEINNDEIEMVDYILKGSEDERKKK